MVAMVYLNTYSKRSGPIEGRWVRIRGGILSMAFVYGVFGLKLGLFVCVCVRVGVSVRGRVRFGAWLGLRLGLKLQTY